MKSYDVKYSAALDIARCVVLVVARKDLGNCGYSAEGVNDILPTKKVFRVFSFM